MSVWGVVVVLVLFAPGSRALGRLAWSLIENRLDDLAVPKDGRDLDSDGLPEADRQARFEEAYLRHLQREGAVESDLGETFHC